ncbi:PadR family transcriptional regulator [Rhizobium jaguaris]|uniref:PadR family transcriptional regulator n=1 Tax=Rhizobium jaguaris TaxID=1312183 RepID=A0A387FKJ5_9HYPH|nr:PadR family transcriptional regulator [Rhizobium jaguaris]AYG57765.1 PadR family transcriptional regulator [Rhizobium jaguaris]
MLSPKRSPIALAILAMLYEAPMHPYRMQRLIKERGKDEVINVTQRASLYQTIQRLDREGLISARQTIRDDKRPERTVYEITERGRAIVVEWMREILSKPGMEYPEFPAAVSFLPLLSPEDALRQLELRAKAIEAELHRTGELLKQAGGLPRLFLLEAEYARAMQATELSWVKAVVGDLRAGHLTWSEAWLRQIAAQFSPDLANGSE